MRLDIIVNKYLLIWHLLYESSVSEEMHNVKQKIWQDHRKGYSLVHKDKDEIRARKLVKNAPKKGITDVIPDKSARSKK